MSRKRKGSSSGQPYQVRRSSKTIAVPWWKRPFVIWVGSIGAALVAATATAIGTGIGQAVYNQLIGHHASSLPVIGSLSISESGNNYQIVTPVFNSQLTDQQVQEINLDIQWHYSVACGVFDYIYKVGEALVVNKVSHVVEGSVTPESGLAPGSVPAGGSLNETCGGYDLSLAFRPPALILAANTTSLVSIDIPKNISETFISPDPGDSVQIPEVIIHPDAIKHASILQENWIILRRQ